MNSFNSLPGPRIIFLDCGQLNQEWSWLVLKTVSRDSSLIFRMAIKCPVSSLGLLKISSSFVWACILQGSRVFCNKLQEFNQMSLVCNLLRRQNSIAETKIFTKILQYARGDLLLRLLAATCCWTCRLVCSDLWRPKLLEKTLYRNRNPRMESLWHPGYPKQVKYFLI